MSIIPPPRLSRSDSARPSSSSSSDLRRISSSKIDSLYEINYLPEDSRVPVTELPLLNPYKAYSKNRSSLVKSVRTLVTPSKAQVKEYVQATRFDQHFLPATQKEQFIPIEIPSHLPHSWLSEGYTHLHFGAVRIALTFHGRKGLPTTSRIALLDSRFPDYRHACIGTVETTLNAGTVLVTIFPNFNMPISDPALRSALKVQVQIAGAIPTVETYMATLHYQMVYRIQNHALDFSLPNSTNDALLLSVDSPNQNPTCTFVPKQLPRSDLLKLMPDSWVTAYEKTHQKPEDTAPIQSAEPSFTKLPDGSVEISFEKETETKPPSCFQTQFVVFPDHPEVTAFNSEGRPIYAYESSGHNPFDCLCQCTACVPAKDTNTSPSRPRPPLDPSKNCQCKGCYGAFHPYNPDCNCDCCSMHNYCKTNDVHNPFVLPDECECSACLAEDSSDDERDIFVYAPPPQDPSDDDATPIRHQDDHDPFFHEYEKGNTKYDLLGEPSGKYDFVVKYSPPRKNYHPIAASGWDTRDNHHPPSPQIPVISMMQPGSPSYNEEFPPLEPYEDKVKKVSYAWKVKNPTTVKADGTTPPTTAAEKVLNWQSENAVVQNRILNRIDQRQARIEEKVDKVLKRVTPYEKCQAKIEELHHQILSHLSHRQPFDHLEQEMKQLKAELPFLQKEPGKLEPDYSYRKYQSKSDPTLHSLVTEKQLESFRRVYGDSRNLIRPHSPSSQVSTTHSSQRSSFSTPKPPIRPSVFISKTTNASTSKPPQMMTNPLTNFLDQLTLQPDTFTPTIFMQDPASTEARHTSDIYSEGSENFGHEAEVVPDSEPEFDADAPLPRVHDFTQHVPATSTKPLFTLDDAPPDQWKQKFQEMHSWCTSEMQRRGATVTTVTTQFVARMIGTLKEWWDNLGPYQQLQFHNAPTMDTLITSLHIEFLGLPDHHLETARQELFKLKCCSYQKKDLDKHYQNFTKRYHAIGGAKDINLRQVYLTSIPEPLAQEVIRHIETKNESLANLSLGDLHQTVLKSLQSLCNQQQFHKQFAQLGSKIAKSCHKPELVIKCKNEKQCDCSHGKKKHHRRIKRFSHKRPFKRNFGQKKRFFKKKSSQQKSRNCFICKQPGHFARNCPNRKKAAKVLKQVNQITQLDLSSADLESLFSETEENSPDVLFAISYPEEVDSDISDTPSDTDFSAESYQFGVQPLNAVLQVPNLKLTLLPDKYSKPLPITGLFDTGAASSILNPALLPPEYWLDHHAIFSVANGEHLTISLISKPVYLQFFPGLKVRHKFLGSSLPGRDIIIGFDLIQQLWKHRVHSKPDGLRFKDQFLPFIWPNQLYGMDTVLNIQQALVKDCCAESHTEFLQKCSKPLWTNPDFYISLPFKRNEDINPTKATHAGMSPDHYELAVQELSTLKAEGLIEQTNSQWACQAFYVNKRSEQVRGKLRLVINYQPLNHFLADCKFPLPTRFTLFSHLSKAKIFSKFDLKAGFWQLGIHPDDRPKTAFCIPNHHYQWTVMPFGLKTAPSLFQKAMLKIFEPISSQALVYIDDILLFSENEESHVALLTKFHQICLQYGIMLSEKKMIIGVPTVEFLGMKIYEGRYELQPHIAQELINFPDDNLSQKQVQQFLGIVNYMTDFIPHLTSIIRPLQLMLKKNAPLWSHQQTTAIQKIKQTAATLPSLQIPSTGTRILQTDASDEFWGAVLLEEKDEKINVCAYKSGSFKESEKHYHSTFKEILAVKRGIEKFQFHLIGHRFIIQMDMTAFPRMLQFKQKQIPHSQLLRWQEWFSKFDFEVKHIKGKKNTLADFLSRPSVPILPLAPPLIAMMNPLPTQPPEWTQIFQNGRQKDALNERMLHYQSLAIQKAGLTALPGLPVHPKYPFYTLFQWIPSHPFPEELLWFLWYLLEQYSFGICFQVKPFLGWLRYPPDQPFAKMFLEWFKKISTWKENFRAISEQRTNMRTTLESLYVILIFRRTSLNLHGAHQMIHNFHEYAILPYNLAYDWETYPFEFREYQRKISELNSTIPPQIWPSICDEVPWESFSLDYTSKIFEDQKIYEQKNSGNPSSTIGCSSTHPQADKATSSSQPSSQTRDTIQPPEAQVQSSQTREEKRQTSQADINYADSLYQDSQDPYASYPFQSEPWWKTLGLPADPYDSDVPAPEANLSDYDSD